MYFTYLIKDMKLYIPTDNSTNNCILKYNGIKHKLYENDDYDGSEDEHFEIVNAINKKKCDRRLVYIDRNNLKIKIIINGKLRMYE